MKTFAPIILFVYKRLWHTQQTLESLKKNIYADKSKLYIFSDGPKTLEDGVKVQEVRNYLDQTSGFKDIERVYSIKNVGLANSVIAGITEVLKEYDRVIVVEDDLVTSPYFLKYMNEGLESYKEFPKIFSICGYSFPFKLMKFPKNYSHDVYLNYRASSWGWGTWRDRWAQADWGVKDYAEFIEDDRSKKLFCRGGSDMLGMLEAQMRGDIDSWAIRWCYAHFRKNGVAVCPVFSYVSNVGLDGSGVHCKKTEIDLTIDLDLAKKDACFPADLQVDESIMKRFRSVISPPTPLHQRLNRKLKKILAFKKS